MRYVTVRHNGRTHAGRVEGDAIHLLDQVDVGSLLREGVAPAIGTVIDYASADLAPVVTHPDKIVCVGVNYRDHIEEMGRAVPSAPTYFAKYRRALIGALDPIRLPPIDVSTHVDFEGELAIIIGTEVRHASAKEALGAIAGFTIMNDVSVRDWQRRTTQFLAGKTFEGSTPVGPSMVTADDVGDGLGLALTTTVDGVVKQAGNTDRLVFGPVDIVADLSRIITLEPGDLIATGTPGGVGAARTPPEWLNAGAVVHVQIEGLGAVRNVAQLPSWRNALYSACGD